MFDLLGCLSVVNYILIKNSVVFYEIVKFWAAEATKMTRALYSSRNANVSKKFAKFLRSVPKKLPTFKLK